MKMTSKKTFEARSALIFCAAEAVPVLFSHDLPDALKIDGDKFFDLEAEICENSAFQPTQFRRAGHDEWASSMDNSRIRD